MNRSLSEATPLLRPLRWRATPWLLVYAVWQASSGWASAAPYGAPFVVSNEVQAGTVPGPTLVTGPNGDTLVLWTGARNGEVVQLLQRYDATGKPFHAAAQHAHNADLVAIAPDGSYALAESWGIAIALTIYDRSGQVRVPRFSPLSPVGFDIRAMAYSPSGQLVLAVTYRSSPELYLLWFDQNYAVSGSAPVWYETAFQQTSFMGVALDFDDTLGFAVAFRYFEPTSGTWRMRYRRLSPSGEPLAAPEDIDPTSAHATLGRIRFTPAGDFVATWSTWAGLIQARTFDTGGAPRSGVVNLVTSDGGIQGYDTAMGPDGSISVAWTEASGGGEFQPYVRSFGSTGEPLGDRFRVNTDGLWALPPAIGIGPSGDLFVSWTAVDTGVPMPFPVTLSGRRFTPAHVPLRTVTAQPITGLATSEGEWIYFYVEVPTGHETLSVSISGGTGDADLYLRRGALPTLSEWDARPYLWGNEESVLARPNVAGTWFIGLHAYASFGGVGLRVSSW